MSAPKGKATKSKTTTTTPAVPAPATPAAPAAPTSSPAHIPRDKTALGVFRVPEGTVGVETVTEYYQRDSPTGKYHTGDVRQEHDIFDISTEEGRDAFSSYMEAEGADFYAIMSKANHESPATRVKPESWTSIVVSHFVDDLNSASWDAIEAGKAVGTVLDPPRTVRVKEVDAKTKKPIYYTERVAPVYLITDYDEAFDWLAAPTHGARKGTEESIMLCVTYRRTAVGFASHLRLMLTSSVAMMREGGLESLYAAKHPRAESKGGRPRKAAAAASDEAEEEDEVSEEAEGTEDDATAPAEEDATESEDDEEDEDETPA